MGRRLQKKILLLILYSLLLHLIISDFLPTTTAKSPPELYHMTAKQLQYYPKEYPSNSLVNRAAGTRFRNRLPTRSDLSASSISSSMLINVDDFGAKGDGTSDDTAVFTNAWKAACSSSSSSAVTLLVPHRKTYLLKPVTFSGPCNSYVTIKVRGTILASPNMSDWSGTKYRYRMHWILFDGVDNLSVRGRGTFDGNGKIWWNNSCKVNKSLPCMDAPTAVTFDSCSNLNVVNLTFQNSQQMHVSFERCNNVKVSNLLIKAPSSSPNTDGIHIAETTNIEINKCVIGTGDDCISIVTGSRYVNATNIYCGPGHGISIGSLGADGSEATVSNILVDTAHLEGTTNGVRIKTYQGGKGYAKSIAFKNVFMKNVENPIIIDQFYCDSSQFACSEQSLRRASAVAISGVTYKNITGTSATSTAMDFDCSNAVACTGIALQNINLTLAAAGGGGGFAKASCNNAYLTTSGTVVPAPCTS